MTRALIVPPSGELTWLDFDANDYPTLRRHIGGPIEMVYVNPLVHAYIHEEGKIEGLPYNPVATFLTGLAGLDVIVGTAVFLGTGSEGEETDLPEEWSPEGFARRFPGIGEVD